MDLVREAPDFENVLRGADGRQLLLNDHALTASCIVAPARLVEHWPVTRLDALTIEAMEPVLALQPDVILLGCGERQVFPPTAVLAAVLKRGVGLETMTNAACARTFNVLAGEGRNVVAAFVLSG